MQIHQRPSKLAIAVAAVWSVFMQACWDYDKLPLSEVRKQLCEAVNDIQERKERICQKMPASRRAECLANVQREMGPIDKAKQDAINAYAACKGGDFKKAKDIIETALSVGKKAVDLVENVSSVLGDEGKVELAMTLTRQSPNLYAVAAGSSAKYTMAAPAALTVDVSGTVALSPLVGDPDTGVYTGTITAFNLSLATAGGATLTLRADGPNAVTLLPLEGGQYAGQMRLAVDAAFGTGDYMSNTFYTVELPLFAASETFDEFAVSTGGKLAGDELVFPVCTEGPRRHVLHFKVPADLVIGTVVQVEIEGEAPNAQYEVYRGTAVADPLATFAGNDYWWLDTAQQTLIASGILDGDGKATIPVLVPNDPGLEGTIWIFQSVVGSPGSQVVSLPVAKAIGLPPP